MERGINIKLVREIKELERIVYGNSPDTLNLDGFKGLVKNQVYILKKNLGLSYKVDVLTKEGEQLNR